MATGFEADSLEKQYAFLDECPPNLLTTVVTLPIGTLRERISGVRNWYDELLAGRLPAAEVWPRAPIDVPVRKALDSMGMLRFCKDQPELIEKLMKNILAAFARQNESFSSEVAEQLQKLEELERIHLTEEEASRARREKRAAQPIQLDENAMQRLREAAERKIASRDPNADPEILADWEGHVRVWTEISDVFGDLGEMLGRGWDLSIGVLKHTGWLDLLRLRNLIESLPQLREIIRALGRLQTAEDNESVAETILVPVRRLEEERLEIRTPQIPAETRGIERSGDIARMLPVEASMLGHPKLRFLWHARRAERALLTYRVEGIEIQQTWTEREDQVEVEGKQPRRERGPIIAVVDTSGSMHGLPEQVAKAIVLEAVRTAHAEKRMCFLYAYSGPGQVLEHELDLSPDGIDNLISFLGFSFGGGNDEASVISKVLARLKKEGWQKADVVIVSDGEWPARANLVRSVKAVCEKGTRFHGVQIGNRGETGLHKICDPVHVFQDWATAGGW